MTSVLLATCSELPDGDEDADLLVAALAAQGLDARWAVWSDPSEDWDGALVVVRSTWDYTTQRDSFLAWTSRVPRLANAAEVVAWSSDKTYLRDLAAAGLPIVPTEFAAPGERPTFPVAGEFVVKPSVGAGSRGAGRFTAADHDAARTHAATLHGAGRTVLVQPYLADVDTAGETALIYVDGRFSHAIRKGAMLPCKGAHDLSGGELFVPEAIVARDPTPDERALGDAVVAELRDRFGADQLYARVDLLPSDQGPVIVELELVEPSLFLEQGGPAAAERFALAVAARR